MTYTCLICGDPVPVEQTEDGICAGCWDTIHAPAMMPRDIV
jgi:hypothetical protein